MIVIGRFYCHPGMETALTPNETRPTDLAVEVVAFFETLRTEQLRFLESMAQARASLRQDDGQLAQISATHARLTRQFFDAQRSIMQRRAEADAEVAAIAVETDEHSHTVLASALAHSAAASLPAPSADDLVSPPGTTTDRDMLERTTRQAAVALSVLAARSQQTASSIEQVVNEAFEVRESEDARFERQLQSVLDEWWAFEKHESKALIDDARARAAMRLHIAHLEACEIMGSAAPLSSESSTEPSSSESSTVGSLAVEPLAAAPSASLAAPCLASTSVDLPAPGASSDAVRALLDNVKSTDLESMFAELELLLGASTPATVPSTESDAIALFAAPLAGTKVDTFDNFWSPIPTPMADEPSVEARGAFASVMMRVVVPITAVTALLAALMAWIG